MKVDDELILDVVSAVSDGCMLVPIAGVYRGEKVKVVRIGQGTSVFVKFVDNHLYPNLVMGVDVSHLKLIEKE